MLKQLDDVIESIREEGYDGHLDIRLSPHAEDWFLAIHQSRQIWRAIVDYSLDKAEYRGLPISRIQREGYGHSKTIYVFGLNEEDAYETYLIDENAIGFVELCHS